MYSLSEVGSEHKVCFEASLRLTKSSGAVENHQRKCDELVASQGLEVEANNRHVVSCSPSSTHIPLKIS